VGILEGDDSEGPASVVFYYPGARALGIPWANASDFESDAPVGTPSNCLERAASGNRLWQFYGRRRAGALAITHGTRVISGVTPPRK